MHKIGILDSFFFLKFKQLIIIFDILGPNTDKLDYILTKYHFFMP